MRDRRNALRLEIVEKRNQLIPIGRLLAASLVESSLVDPHPVGGVNIDGRSNPVAVIFGKFLQGSRNNLFPAFLGSNRIEIAECALLRPVANVKTQHLHRGWRIACGNARAQNGHGFRAAATCNRHIGPANALAFKIFFQNFKRGRFAAGRPPVQNLDILLFLRIGNRRHSGEQSTGSRTHRGKFQKFMHVYLP